MRYFLGVLVIIFFVVVGSIFLIGRSRRAAVTTISNDVTISNYIDSQNSSVSWTMQGDIVANDDHRAVRVTVTPAERTIEILKGYENEVIKSEKYTNNKDAYRVFLKALDNAGFGIKRNVKLTDEEGVCPTGKRYIYELKDAGNSVLRSWSTSCSNRDGTFGGAKATTVRTLFQDQISEYNAFIRGVQF